MSEPSILTNYDSAGPFCLLIRLYIDQQKPRVSALCIATPEKSDVDLGAIFPKVLLGDKYHNLYVD